MKTIKFPCRSLPRAQWCDNNGPGGFSGHTCHLKQPPRYVMAEPVEHGTQFYELTDRKRNLSLATIHNSVPTAKFIIKALLCAYEEDEKREQKK